MIKPPNNYSPPESREELIQRYAQGERHFPNTDLSETDLSGVNLDGASFDNLSWFFNSNFDDASLKGVSFRECNVKCASFRNANLTKTSFELASIESIDIQGAITSQARFVGATFYGYTIEDENELPPPRSHAA